MHYYRSSSDETERSSILKSGLLVLSVAVIVFRAAQLVGGVDFNSAIDTLTSVFR